MENKTRWESPSYPPPLVARPLQSSPGPATAAAVSGVVPELKPFPDIAVTMADPGLCHCSHSLNGSQTLLPLLTGPEWPPDSLANSTEQRYFQKTMHTPLFYLGKVINPPMYFFNLSDFSANLLPHPKLQNSLFSVNVDSIHGFRDLQIGPHLTLTIKEGQALHCYTHKLSTVSNGTFLESKNSV